MSLAVTLWAIVPAWGNIAPRERHVWLNPDGTTNHTQSLSWDARGRLHAITETNANGSGYNWSAVYDPLNRRIQTITVFVTNGVPFATTPNIISSFYDPQVEFLELGVSYGTNTEWKLYGPDLNGRYGGLNGTGGFDGVSPNLNPFDPVISDFRGNVLGVVTNGAVFWNPSRPTGYGAVPNYRPAPLGSSGAGIAISSAWRGHWPDITGYYQIGLRPYDPIAGQWLTFDSVWNARDPNYYTFCGGDPVNSFDPDGRCANSLINKSFELRDSPDVSDHFLAMPYGLAGALLKIPGAVSDTFSDASDAMAQAHQDINQYSGGQAFLARTLSLPADIAFGTTKLFNDPVDAIPQIPGGIVQLGQNTINDPGKFVNNPSVNTAFNLVDDATAWYMLGKTVQGVSGNIATPGSAPDTVVVSRWGSQGLQPGNWVMNGPATLWNYLLSFKWQPGGGNEYAPPSSGQQFQVPAGSVQWPSGWGIDGAWKGIFGQRQYVPETPPPTAPPPTTAPGGH